MTIGEKIKKARLDQGLTQSQLAGEEITRNMLSAIESGKATPSISTLEHIASGLNLPVAYLLSSEDDITIYKKSNAMPTIQQALSERDYLGAIRAVERLGNYDDELSYILALSYFEAGIASFKSGLLLSAKKYLFESSKHCKATLYDTARFEAIIPMYLAIAENVNAPLLEFNEESFIPLMQNAFDYEFYKYFTMDFEYDFTNFQFKTHMEAKRLIKERQYSEALALLLSIENSKQSYERNSYVLFSVYADLEVCYKQLYDFENAYKFASKRLSMIEGFNG